MFTLPKLYSLLLVLGVVISVVDAMPVSSVDAEQALSARKIKFKTKCQARAAAKSTKGKAKRDFDLVRRSNHPSPKDKITLYHGSEGDFDFDHGQSTQNGDFHFGKPGFYMTDSAEAAAHYACVSGCLTADKSATVLEFQWDGTKNYHTFPSTADPTWTAYQKWVDAHYFETLPSPRPAFDAMHNLDMISGPMSTPGDVANGVRSDFWQYALLNPAAASKLHKLGSKQIKCGTVVKYD